MGIPRRRCDDGEERDKSTNSMTDAGVQPSPNLQSKIFHNCPPQFKRLPSECKPRFDNHMCPPDVSHHPHETILDAIEEICRKAGITTERRNIPSIKKHNGKMGRGDLVLKHVNLGGHRHLVLDVAVNHEFGGDHLAEVSRNASRRAAKQDPREHRSHQGGPLQGRICRSQIRLPDLRHLHQRVASTASSCASSTSSPTAAP